MNNISSEIIKKFHTALPTIHKWIDDLLEKNKGETTPVANLGFTKLKQIFPVNLLEKAKVVTVKNNVPVPPLSSIGLSELSEMENMTFQGITYKDTFFVNQLCRTESLHFHELVHVVQWEILGVNNFLLAYGLGLIQFGYIDSPLEKIAYSLQEKFEKDIVNNNIIGFIQQQTEAVWNQIAPLVNLV